MREKIVGCFFSYLLMYLLVLENLEFVAEDL